MYPGDPNAAGANVYNCRCTLIAAINGHEIDGSEVYKNNHRPELEGISWEEWKAGHKSPLTYNEQHAINSYIGSDSYKINDKLRRGKELTQEEKTIVKNLDSALKKMPKYKGDLLRAVDFTGYQDCDKRTEKFLEGYKIGEPITCKEYISTSEKAGYNDGANIRICISNSKKGRNIILYNGSESEVLYERGSSFITKAVEYHNGKYNILLEEK